MAVIRVPRFVGGAALPVAVWLLGLGVFTAFGIENLFPGRNPVFVVARVTAYLTTGAVAATTLACTAIFALACGIMLNWLGESLSPTRIAMALARSFWCVAAYVWSGVLLVVIDPPLGMTAADMAEPGALEARVGETAAFAWMSRLRYVALGSFLGLTTWLLARQTRPWNAVIAVAFGIAALAALTTALGMLAGSEPV